MRIPSKNAKEMKMKFDIDWDTVEAIGTEYVKQTPMRYST